MRITRRSSLFGAAIAAAAFGQKPASDPYPDAAPYVPTPPEVVEAMLKTAGVKPNDTVYDLGCGDGRIVIMAAQKFGARGVGVEIDPDLVREAKQHAEKAGVS